MWWQNLAACHFCLVSSYKKLKQTKTQNCASPNRKSKANRRRWILQQIITNRKPDIVRYKHQKKELKDDQKQLNRQLTPIISWCQLKSHVTSYSLLNKVYLQNRFTNLRDCSAPINSFECSWNWILLKYWLLRFSITCELWNSNLN